MACAAATTAAAPVPPSRRSRRATTTSASSIETSLSEPAELWWAPVETISNSEGGFERVYQGAGILMSWPLTLAPGSTRTVTVSHVVATSADHAADERAGTTAPGAP